VDGGFGGEADIGNSNADNQIYLTICLLSLLILILGFFSTRVALIGNINHLKCDDE
jgi:hypothetical protein